MMNWKQLVYLKNILKELQVSVGQSCVCMCWSVCLVWHVCMSVGLSALCVHVYQSVCLLCACVSVGMPCVCMCVSRPALCVHVSVVSGELYILYTQS